jgi:hypothetical protein
MPNFMFENDRQASFFFGLGLQLAAQQRGSGFRRRGGRRTPRFEPGRGLAVPAHRSQLRLNTVIAGIAVLTAFALLLDAVVTRIEKRRMKWQPKSGETEKP